VHRGDAIVAEYELRCDLSESLALEPDELAGEMNKVGLVVTPSNPNGLLLTSCRVGAHSKALAIYDLDDNGREPVWVKTGSYFAEWSVNESNELLLSYDKPCNGRRCAAPFSRESVLWSGRQ